MEKTCSKCGETKPLSAYYRNKRAKDGRQSACKECRSAEQQAYYTRNGDRIRATVAAYRKANPERVAAIQKVWREANPERVAAGKKAWAEANPERAAATKKAWNEANLKHVRDSMLQNVYGLSLPEDAEILEAQDNRCAICGGAPKAEGRRLAVDHDHETGQVRGLLCTRCNPGLGFFMHDPERLRNAIAYLDQWGQG